MKNFLFCLAIFMTLAIPFSLKAITVLEPYRIGEMLVYPIEDAANAFGRDIFPDDEETKQKMNAAFPRPESPASINVFLVRYANKWILIDTGLGTKESKIMTTFELLHITPRQIDIVILTHNHADHTGGILDSTGKARYPYAQLWISMEELASGHLRSEDPDPTLKKISDTYNKRINTFEEGTEILPGLIAHLAPGHTVGHAVIEFKDKMLFIGDLLHAVKWQFANPEICSAYDQDDKTTVASRVRILNMAADKKLVVAGAHLPYPGLGTVKKNTDVADRPAFRYFQIKGYDMALPKNR